MGRLSPSRIIVVFACMAASGAAACGAEGVPRAPSAAGVPFAGTLAPTPAPRLTGPPSNAPSAAPSPSAPAAPLDPVLLFARLRPELSRCYALGKKTTPEMADGKLTLNASIDEQGRPDCVIPSDHTGLTQEVEDCMSAGFTTLELAAGGPPSVSLPVVVRAGVIELGARTTDAALIESVETFRMPDAFEVLESLEPALQACVRDVDRSRGARSVLVGARVGADGLPRCALATSRGELPAHVVTCAAGVLRAAKFPPPKRGAGLVLVPIGLRGSGGTK